MNQLNAQVQMFWEDFLKNNGLSLTKCPQVHASIPGNKQIADGLIALYLTGKKTAASGLVKDYELAGDPLPKTGDYWIVLDSNEQPRCIAKTVRVEIHPFEEVTEEIAIAEGEGDLSLHDWREVHRHFFNPMLSKLRIDNLNKALVVTEFFKIWYTKSFK